MIRRWILYALALTGAVALRVAYTGWLAQLLLAATAALPLLGVALALPGALTGRARLEAEREHVERGGQGRWRVTCRSGLGIPLGRVKARVEWTNAMTGRTNKEKRTWFVPGGGSAVEIAAGTDRCGLLTGRITRAWALDCLGLFWLPLRRSGQAKLWVEPAAPAGEAPSLPEEETPGVRPKPGGGPGEDYDPRPYRPGDPLNAIHWKLSAKRDELVTRETLETVRPLPLLTLDCFGPEEEMDRTLETLEGTCRALLEAGRSFSLAWAEPASGELRRFDVAGEADWRRCREALLAQRWPETGRSVLDVERLGRSLHLTGGGGA